MAGAFLEANSQPDGGERSEIAQIIDAHVNSLAERCDERLRDAKYQDALTSLLYRELQSRKSRSQ